MINPIYTWYKKAEIDYRNIDSFPDNTKQGVYYNYIVAKGAYENLVEDINFAIEQTIEDY